MGAQYNKVALKLVVLNTTYIYIYIYIYRERERESIVVHRLFDRYSHDLMILISRLLKTNFNERIEVLKTPLNANAKICPLYATEHGQTVIAIT